MVARATINVCAVAFALHTAGCGLLYFSSKEQSQDFEPLPPPVLKVIGAGLVVPVLLFGALDVFLRQGAWDWLGEIKGGFKPTSTEADHEGAFLRRTWNAQSSNAQFTAGCFVLYHALSSARGSNAAIFLGVSLMILGLASYAWWGSRRQLAWRIDHLFMEVATAGLSISFIAVAVPSLEHACVALGLATCVLRGIAGRKAALLVTGVLAYVTAVFASVASGGHGSFGVFALGLALKLYGFIPKVADVNGDFAHGTAVFHWLEAAGDAVLFSWGQTLPVAADPLFTGPEPGMALFALGMASAAFAYENALVPLPAVYSIRLQG